MYKKSLYIWYKQNTKCKNSSMKTNVVKKLWSVSALKTLLVLVFFAWVTYCSVKVKYDSIREDVYWKVAVPNKVLTDTIDSWAKDTVINGRHLSTWCYGDTVIRVNFSETRNFARVSLSHPKFQEEDFWWYSLVMEVFPSNYGDQWEISLEKEKGQYYLVCERNLINRISVGSIFAFGLVIGFWFCYYWNKLSKRKKED